MQSVAQGTEAPAPVLHCSQCGGVLEPAEGQVFLTCPYCSSTVFIDKSRVVFHWAVACTVPPDEAEAALRRWMAGNQTVKGLDVQARVAPAVFQYFPLWYSRCGAASAETVYLEPAAALSVTELKQLALPAGDLRKYDPALDAQAVAPTVPLDTVARWLAERGVAPDSVRERALVHVPLYTFKYDFGGHSYTALVDGASGKVFANLFPAKWEVPYRAIGAGGCLLYFLLSWIPTVGYSIAQGTGLLAGIVLYLVLAVVLAVPLFAAAAYVSSKV